VEATGTAPLRYQWKKGAAPIDGATNSSYTTPATSLADSGTEYSVDVSNDLGTVTSSTANLTVNARYSQIVNNSGVFYPKTECVKDNSTGLVWEGKPTTGTRAASNTYTNYDSTTSAQKQGVIFGTYVNPTQGEIDASTNSIGYVSAVNSGSGVCGYTDWRLPTKDELAGIFANSGSPRIDTTWFPNTQANYYWSSSPYVGNSYTAWGINFRYGNVNGNYRENDYAVRLVRGTSQ
ncbi:MAG: DUF1566 domain-containing protein, partial [Rhodoferax sp.]|nr:DUF1566 domain-containing protein [Rhodoferax sp.]